MVSPNKSATKRGLWSEGEPFVWLTAGALSLTLMCIAVLLAVVAVNGLGVLWPANLSRIELTDGSVVLGDIIREEDATADTAARIQVKVGNRDLYDLDFRWIDREAIESISEPEDIVVLERLEWGNFYGYLKAMPPGTPTKH